MIVIFSFSLSLFYLIRLRYTEYYIFSQLFSQRFFLTFDIFLVRTNEWPIRLYLRHTQLNVRKFSVNEIFIKHKTISY